MEPHPTIQGTINLRAEAEGSPKGASQQLRSEIRKTVIPRLEMVIRDLELEKYYYELSEDFVNWTHWRLDKAVWETICK